MQRRVRRDRGQAVLEVGPVEVGVGILVLVAGDDGHLDRAEVRDVVRNGGHVVVAGGQPAALAAVGVGDGAALAQIVPDAERVGDVARVEHVEVGRPVLHGRGVCHGTPLAAVASDRCLTLLREAAHPGGPSTDSDPALSGTAVRPHAGRAGCGHGRSPGRDREGAHDMTGTTAQTPSADDGTELPRPRRGARWRWARPRRALVAGGTPGRRPRPGRRHRCRRRGGHHDVTGTRPPPRPGARRAAAWADPRWPGRSPP